MNVAHTPAPWLFTKPGHIDGILIDSNTAGICILHNRGNALKPVAQMEADARLIAAAPKLLRAASFALQASIEGWPPGTSADARDLLKDAIDATKDPASSTDH